MTYTMKRWYRSRRSQVIIVLLIVSCTLYALLSDDWSKWEPHMKRYSKITRRSGEHLAASWPKRIPATVKLPQNPEEKNLTNKINPNFNSNIKLSPTNMMRPVMLENATSLKVTKIMDGIKNVSSTENAETKKNELELPLCNDEVPEDLGPIPVNMAEVKLELVEKLYPEVQSGGIFTPLNCTARHKVAIIIPFRDRLEHLPIFLRHMHPFLMTQQVEYGIFIVEQEGSSVFNRAKLMNVGFVESQKLKEGGWQCFIFHDVDLFPVDLRNTYSCPRQPRHMSVAVDRYKFKLPYETLFGGVSAMTLEQFTKVNGFSNRYWGWGSEDDDMSERVRKVGYHIARYRSSIARYVTLEHKRSPTNPKRFQLRSQTVYQKDGLSSLEYQILQVTRHHLYTHILANIDAHCLGTNGLSRSNAKQVVLKTFYLLLFTTVWLLIGF